MLSPSLAFWLLAELMLISVFCWLLLVEGVAESIGFLPHPLGIHLCAKGSLLQTPAELGQRRREFV